MQDLNTSLHIQKQSLFHHFMGDCKRSALILPKFQCQQMAKNLTHQDHRHVFVGVQVSTNVTESLNFFGFVPTYLRRRITGMQTPGIWDWWNKIIASRYKNDGKGAPSIEKPTMAGNIQVIFVVHAVGITISILSFVGEIRQKSFAIRRRLNTRMFLDLARSILSVERVRGNPKINRQARLFEYLIHVNS